MSFQLGSPSEHVATLMSDLTCSAIQVLTKMLDGDFHRRLKSSGLVENTYLGFRRAGAGESDKILDWALAYLIATVVRDQRIAEPLLKINLAQVNQGTEDDMIADQASDVLGMVSGMLGRSWAGEVIEPATKGFSKPEKLTVTSLQDIINKSGLVEPGSFKVSPMRHRGWIGAGCRAGS